MTNRRLNEDFMSTLSSGIRSLLDIPIVKSIVSTLSGGGADDDESSPDPDKLQFGEMLRDLMQERIPLRTVLEADTDKRGLIVGSSQSGIIGPYVMQGLESRGFKSFNFGSSALRTPRTMRLVFASIASGLKDKDEYDAIVIFAGYRSGESTSDIIDIVNLFTPGRCFVVIPPPVTMIDNTLEASRIGINKGRPLSEDFWFLLRDGKYAREREQYCSDLVGAVRSAGATSIDPRNIVSGGKMQPTGIAFPNSPDGIHADRDTNMKIADSIVTAIFSCEIPVPASQVVKKIKPDDLKKNPEIAKKFSSYPALSSVLGVAAVGRVSSGMGMRNNPITGKRSSHEGLDIAIRVGTPIMAPMDGTVIRTVNLHPKAGNYIDMGHANGDVTRYLHLSQINVKQGQAVNQGDVIGLSGNTGSSTGPHLHWETWQGGEKRSGGELKDPRDWLKDNPSAVSPVTIA